MRRVLDTVWERRGTSWIWDEEARNRVCAAEEVWSLRQFLRAAGGWPDELPSNGGRTLVVAGLDGVLDLLEPAAAESWLGDAVKSAILRFQDDVGSEGALHFWLPHGHARLKVQAATDAVSWVCEAPHRGVQIDFSRVLWGEANEYPQEILLRDGATPAGLFHLRIT